MIPPRILRAQVQRTGAREGSFLLLLCAAPLACGGPPENPPPRCEGKLCTVEEGAHLRTVVDASDREAWVFLDLETAAEVTPEEPKSSDAWDLGFQRYAISSNGGISGAGGVEVAILDEEDFESLDRAPADGYVIDEEDQDGDDEADLAFLQEGAWYDYDLLTHTLSPKARVYVVKTVEGGYFKLRMDGYYDADGVAGHPSFTWSAINPP